jgi:chitinase
VIYNRFKFVPSYAALFASSLIAVGCSTGEDRSDTAQSEGIAQTQQAVTMSTHVVEGYWHNFYNSSVCPMRLTSVASYWDVIHVAFADNAGSGNVAFNLYTPAAGEPCSAMDPTQFKADIATLKSQGKNVVLSLGGAAGAIAIGSTSDQTNFVNSLKNIITTWGFSGVDIDLESGSSFIHGSTIQQLLPGALQTLSSWYSSSGPGGHMFLSMAPEHPYVHGGVVAYSGIWGAYLPMITQLSSQLDVLHCQLYNNGSVTTPNVAPYNGATFPMDSVDNLVASVKMLVEGFDTAGGPHFNGIAASQVAFGVPSGPKSSNPPFISTSTINNAYDCITANVNCGTLHMANTQPSFRGVMTWSINWDAYDVANNTAGRVDFANIRSHMNGGSSCTPTTCSAQGKNCGSISDGCGGTLSCGSCTSPQTCGGGGTANVCGSSSGTTTSIDDSVQGTGANQFNYSGAGWGHCTNCSDGNTNMYNLSNSWDLTANDNFTLAFSGTKVALYGVKDLQNGIAAVSVDGGSETNVDFYGSTRIGNQLLWTSPVLSSGSHTFKVRVTGTKNASSTNSFVVPDRVDVTSGGTCTPTTCSAQGKNCGSISDGCGGTLSCGSCTSPQTCGGGGTANVCGSSCTPTTCSAQGKNCGSISDGCGGTLSCGSCTSPQTCGGGGTANVCGGGSSGTTTSIDDSVQGTGTNQFNYSGTGWGHCTNCSDGNTNMYNLSNSWDLTANDYFTLGFSGTQVALYGVKDVQNGIAAVSIDGGAETNVDFYGSTRIGNQLLWTSATLASGSHTVKVRVTGTKNASSSNSYVVPDRVDVTSGGSSCTPTTCSAQGKNCGSISDGCSGTLNCGSCTSPQTCGGGGTANVCGGGGGSTCATAYSQGNCNTYVSGTQVSSGGHNWTCSNGNCANCAGYTTCAPGGTGCPWGTVWTDNGTCN